MDIPDLYVRAQDSFGERVHQISGDQWGAATPCADWDAQGSGESPGGRDPVGGAALRGGHHCRCRDQAGR